jgi:hypothetical protein
MRNSLLTTVAALALAAGTVAVSAQGRQGGEGAGGMQQGGPSAGQSERMDRGGQGAGQKQQESGQMGQSRQGQDGQMGQSPRQEKGTTGQAPRGEQKDKAGQERGTTGQAPRGEQKDKAGQQRQERGTTGQERQGQQPGRDMQREGQQPSKDMQRGERDREPGAAQDRGGEAGASVTLNTEQKTKIRETVLQRGGAPRVSRSDINVDIRVGTTIPRERVRLVTVPQTVVEIQPRWRGYLYFVLEDEIIIVHPQTYRIVAVLQV